MSDPHYPRSIREINSLSESEKVEIYRSLIPQQIFTDFGIDGQTFIKDGHKVVWFRCPSGSRAVEITVKNEAKDIDPLLYLNMADTFNNQLLVLLVQVNDPNSPRFNTDYDEQGNPTNFGTSSRNIPAEKAAMDYGLAPGQIRSGLRSFRKTVPVFEEFVSRMGHHMFFIEPLAYHNAIVFERYGFNYLRGLKEMQRIHVEFQPSGDYYKKLHEQVDNPFRQPDAYQSVRGRSWAIHDGILGHSYTGFQMYKQLGKDAGIHTFPDAIW